MAWYFQTIGSVHDKEMGENLGYKNRMKGEAAHDSNAHGDGDVVNQIAE